MPDQNEDDTEYKPQKEFSFVVHDYKIESDKKDEDGIPVVDRIILRTKSPEVNRGKVTHRPEVVALEKVNGKKVHTPTDPNVAQLEDPIDTILDKVEDGELVQITATVTEIIPEDGGDPYHAINKNHDGTIEARILKGEDAEKFKDEFLRDDDEDESPEVIS